MPVVVSWKISTCVWKRLCNSLPLPKVPVNAIFLRVTPSCLVTGSFENLGVSNSYFWYCLGVTNEHVLELAIALGYFFWNSPIYLRPGGGTTIRNDGPKIRVAKWTLTRCFNPLKKTLLHGIFQVNLHLRSIIDITFHHKKSIWKWPLHIIYFRNNTLTRFFRKLVPLLVFLNFAKSYPDVPYIYQVHVLLYTQAQPR